MAVSMKMTVVVLTASTIRASSTMMEAVSSTYETPVNLYETTWRKMPEDIFTFFNVTTTKVWH
jgi:hypothetical protein